MLQQMMTFWGSVDSARETYVGGIPHNLVLDFLPSFQTLLNQDLGTETQTPSGQIPQFLLIMGETGT
jgi:hypothetical protein